MLGEPTWLGRLCRESQVQQRPEQVLSLFLNSAWGMNQGLPPAQLLTHFSSLSSGEVGGWERQHRAPLASPEVFMVLPCGAGLHTGVESEL